MEQIEQAVLIALDQTANRELQTQAMQFCEQLKQNKDGWCECLRLFTRDPKAVSEARLFCLQVLDHALTRSTSALSASAADVAINGGSEPVIQKLNAEELSLVKNQLGAYIQRELSLQSASRDPPFIRNKLATTFTYLFIETYDTIWPTMVADLITLATETASGSSSGTSSGQSTPPGSSHTSPLQQQLQQQQRGVLSGPATDFALRVLKAIDEQVVDKAVVRTKEQLTKCNAIKDHLREGDVRTLVGFLRASLSSALPVAVSSVSPSSAVNIVGLSSSSDAGEICELSLKLAGAYVSWVDINLIADAEFLTPVFTALQRVSRSAGSAATNDSAETPINVRIAACDALVEIIGKGMQPLDKMTLLRMLGATNVIESMLQDTCSSANEMMDGKYEFIEGLARLTNATGKAFAAIWFDATAQDPSLAAAAATSSSGASKASSSSSSSKGASSHILSDYIQVLSPAQVSELQSAAMMEIERLVPLLLRFLSDEYEDTSEIMFEFLNDLLSLFKKMKKLLLSSQGSSNLLLPNSIRQILLSLMDVILQKMKYEDDYSYENENENENEDHVIVFAELRKRLKQFADAISMLDSEVYDQRVSSITRSTMNILLNNSNSSNTSNTSNNSIPNWTHVELAIYITNMYGDVCSRGQRGGINFSDALNDSQSVNVRERNLAQLLVLMIEAISNYLNTPGGSHPAVSLAFFETVVRFGGLFDARPSMIPAILRSFLAGGHRELSNEDAIVGTPSAAQRVNDNRRFVGGRGVHHPNKAARIRSWYLLSRFINNVKLQYMAPLTFDVISALADLLIVAAEPPSSNTSPIMSNVSSGQMMTGSFADAAGSQSLFDSHAYLFEVAGLLISSSLIEPSQRLQLMEAVFGPIFNGITNIMNKYDLLSTSDPWVPLQLHHLLTAIGALCKSFPSDTLASTIGSRSSNSDVKHYARSEQETMLIIKATEAVLVVLDRVYRFEPIRFAARYSFSRLLNTLGMAIMPYLRPFITQLLRDCDIAELSDFFNFMTQVAFKFKESAIPHIAELVIPMLNKVFEFLNKSPSGTDEVVQLVNLRKAYLSWLIALFNDDIDTVLLTGINQEHLLTILESMALLCEPASNSALASVQIQKLAFSSLHKCITAWMVVATPEAEQLINLLGQLLDSSSSSAAPSGSAAPRSAAASSMGGFQSKQPSASASNNPLLATFQGIASAQLRPVRPLPGFESFVRDRVVPLLLTIPANTATFNIADGQTQILLGEIAAMFKTILLRWGPRQFVGQCLIGGQTGANIARNVGSSLHPSLASIASDSSNIDSGSSSSGSSNSSTGESGLLWRTIKCPEHLASDFGTALITLPPKDWKRYLTRFFTPNTSSSS